MIILDLRKIKEENYFKVPSFKKRGTSVRECVSCTSKCQRPGLVNKVEKCRRGGWGFRDHGRKFRSGALETWLHGIGLLAKRSN